MIERSVFRLLEDREFYVIDFLESYNITNPIYRSWQAGKDQLLYSLMIGNSTKFILIRPTDLDCHISAGLEKYFKLENLFNYIRIRYRTETIDNILNII